MKILLMIVLMAVCFVSCTGRNSSKPVVSSGSLDKNDYEPTVDKAGEYKTIDGNDNQVQYQGSQEQKNDLNKIDEYSKSHPGF